MTETTNKYSRLEDVFKAQMQEIENQLKSLDPPEPDPPIFEETYTVKSLSEWDEKKALEYEYGNRIVAPEADFNKLIKLDANINELILQITNPNYKERVSHCSAIEWTAPSGTIYVPSWMKVDFKIKDTEKDKMVLRYYKKPFLKGSFIQIQPFKLASVQSTDFNDVKKLFEESLKKYQCLTIGDTLRIKYNDNVHLLEVIDVLSAQSIAGVTPFNVVSIVNTDVSVDFMAPKDAPPPQPTEQSDTGYGGYGDSYANIPDATNVVQATQSTDHKIDDETINDHKIEEPKEVEKTFSGTSHQLNDDNNDDKIKAVEAFTNITPQKIVCNEGAKFTTIGLRYIGGRQERLKVNMSHTVKQLYAHVKAASTHEGQFELLDGGRPPKPLTDPDATMESAKLSNTRITQRAV